MVDSVFDDIGDDIPPEDFHGPLWQFMADLFTGSESLPDQQYLADLLGVTLEQLPDFLANESASNEQLQAMYAYKELLENNPDWNDLTNEEKNALLEEAGLSGSFGGTDTGTDTPKTLGDLLDELAAEEEVDRDVLDGIVDMIETVKGSVPTDPESVVQTVKDILGSTILGSALEDCESWTDTTTTDNGTVVPSWTKCVDVGIFGIPGLDLPLPPGMIDISTSVYDIIQTAEDIGQSFEDFINDPTGWLEDLVDKAIEKVQDIWGDITGGIDPKSTGDLLDILNDWLGNILGGYILSQVQEATEELDPFLYAQNCTDEGFQEPYEGYCDEAGAINCGEQLNKAGGIVLNAAECGECLQEGFKDFGNGCEAVCQYDDSIPASNTAECKEPYEDNGPTAQQCKDQNKTHIPGNPNANPPTQSECGGCLSGFNDDAEEGNCQENDPDINDGGDTPEECRQLNREYIEPTDISDAYCGGCLEGFEEREGKCEPKQQVDCAAQNKQQVDPYTCGDCISTHEDVQGTCVEKCEGNQIRVDGTCQPVCPHDSNLSANDEKCKDPNTGTNPQVNDPCDSNGDGTLDGTYQVGLGLGPGEGQLECVPGPGPEPELCEENNATVETNCTKCADGSAPAQHIDGDCLKDRIQGETPLDECTDPNATNQGELGPCECPENFVVSADGKQCIDKTTVTCNDPNRNVDSETGGCAATCKDGSLAPETGLCPEPVKTIVCPDNSDNPGQEVSNIESCYNTESPCRDQVYASENQEECWQRCKDGTYKANAADCPDGTEEPICVDNPQTDQEKKDCGWTQCPDSGVYVQNPNECGSTTEEGCASVDCSQPRPEDELGLGGLGLTAAQLWDNCCGGGGGTGDTCTDENATNTGELGDCQCPQGFTVSDDGSRCIADTTPPPVDCADYNQTTNEDGTCGECLPGFVRDTSLPDEPCVPVGDPCPTGFSLDPDTQLCTEIVCGEGEVFCASTGQCENPVDCPDPTPPPPPTGGGGGAGGGGGGGSMFSPYSFAISADPELLKRQEFPITDFLAGIFTNSRGGKA